jgi:hypothetical protein
MKIRQIPAQRLEMDDDPRDGHIGEGNKVHRMGRCCRCLLAARDSLLAERGRVGREVRCGSGCFVAVGLVNASCLTGERRGLRVISS